MSERIILHSDLNCFYASVEMMLNPHLKDKAVAVCGSTDDRHGIVLAKSELAKKAGIKTGMVNFEAKKLCPNLIIVPPQYEQYLKYSRLARQIYQRYTDRVEPYGMDECWLDITGSTGLFGSGEQVAQSIRTTMYEELGLTVSIGVSFNKIFAKLGSDLKKPDAVTCISRQNFKEKIWKLPASDLFYVGRATAKKLNSCGIFTIGEIANSPQEYIKKLLGKNGLMLWQYANGFDTSAVMPSDYQSQIKSVGHGITCYANLENNDEVWKVILELSQDIGHKLKLYGLMANGASITIKDNQLNCSQFQTQINISTQSTMKIATTSNELFKRNYKWENDVRAITVRAINLQQKEIPHQLSLVEDSVSTKKNDKLELTVDDIRRRYGKKAVFSAVLMGDIKMPKHTAHELIMPGMMGK